MKIEEADLFKLEVDNLDLKKFNKFEYHFLISWYKIVMGFSNIMQFIFPVTVFRRVHLFWYHSIHTKYFRKIEMLRFIYANQTSDVFTCAMCGNVVFKGSVAYGIIMNCPNCGSTVSIHRDAKNKIVRTTMSTKNKVDNYSLIHTDLSGSEKILGIEYNIKDF